jgi:hypothetical protein
LNPRPSGLEHSTLITTLPRARVFSLNALICEMATAMNYMTTKIIDGYLVTMFAMASIIF